MAFRNTSLLHPAGWTGKRVFLHSCYTRPVTDGDTFERLHYDHLDIVEGHRQRGCSDMVAGKTRQILTEAGPSVHGVLLMVQLSEL